MRALNAETYGTRRAAVAVLAISLAGCSGPKSFTSRAAPEEPAFTWRNSSGTTNLLANAHAVQSGIGGSTLSLSTVSTAGSIIDQLTLDRDGNIGARGHLYVTVPTGPASGSDFPGGAIGLLRSTKIAVVPVTGPTRDSLAVSFVNGVPPLLGGEDPRSLDETRTVIISIAAITQLEARVKALESEVADLKRKVK